MTFSIIISTKDRADDLRNTVASIALQTSLPYEVIIVDASPENVYAENKRNCEKALGGKARLIYLESSPGVNKQRNFGADNASGEIIFFFDDDVVLNEDYCEKILEVYQMKKDCNVGGVQGCILNYYKLPWLMRTYKKLFFMTRASKNEKSRFLPSLGYAYIFKPDEIIEVEAMPSLICSYYKTVFNEFKFDEAFERCTDLELSYRVFQKYKLYQTPYALAKHNSTPDTHMNIRNRNKVYIIYAHKLVMKHMPKNIANWLAYYWSIVGELIFNTIKSCAHLNINPILGTFDGIKSILRKSGN